MRKSSLEPCTSGMQTLLTGSFAKVTLPRWFWFAAVVDWSSAGCWCYPDQPQPGSCHSCGGFCYNLGNEICFEKIEKILLCFFPLQCCQSLSCWSTRLATFVTSHCVKRELSMPGRNVSQIRFHCCGFVVQPLELRSHLLQAFHMISNHHQKLSDVRAFKNVVKITIWNS